eukprot:scaffold60163_cov28-Tisochrysis_lutea.AAC.4
MDMKLVSCAGDGRLAGEPTRRKSSVLKRSKHAEPEWGWGWLLRWSAPMSSTRTSRGSSCLAGWGPAQTASPRRACSFSRAHEAVRSHRAALATCSTSCSNQMRIADGSGAAHTQRDERR